MCTSNTGSCNVHFSFVLVQTGLRFLMWRTAISHLTNGGVEMSFAFLFAGKTAFQVSKSIWTTDLWQLLCLSVITIRSRWVRNICWQSMKHKSITSLACKHCGVISQAVRKVYLGDSNEINPVYLCIFMNAGGRYALRSPGFANFSAAVVPDT